MFFLLVGSLVIILDQLSKGLVRLNIPVNESVHLFNGDLIWFWHLRNSGAAFGMNLLPPAVIITLSILAILGILTFFLVNKRINPRLGLPLAFFLAGATGNLIDRLFFGEVIDFISVNLPDAIMWRWPSFNIADASLITGVFLLIFFSPDKKTECCKESQATNESHEL